MSNPQTMYEACRDLNEAWRNLGYALAGAIIKTELFRITAGDKVSSELVEVNFDRIVRENDASYLVEIGEGFDAEQFWLPKSQTDMGEDEKHALIPEWLAIEKGLV